MELERKGKRKELFLANYDSLKMLISYVTKSGEKALLSRGDRIWTYDLFVPNEARYTTIPIQKFQAKRPHTPPKR